MNNLIPIESVINKIYVIRNKKVMLDKDLAELYGVKVKRLNEQVKRNIARFPEAFMFQLTDEEYGHLSLRSHFATLKKGQHRKYLPFVFTEHGALMLSSVLNTEQAINMSLLIIEAFVKIKEILLSHKELLLLKKKLSEIEQKYDNQFRIVFETIDLLLDTKQNESKHIGFL